MRIHNQKDFFAGLLLAAFGLLAVVFSRNYPAGIAARMGPGYFPILLGGLLAILGFIVSLRSFGGEREIPVGGFAFRPMMFVLGGVLAFSLLVDRAGLILSILTLTVTAGLAGSESKPREIAFLSLVLAALALGIFVYGLKLPFKVWPL